MPPVVGCLVGSGRVGFRRGQWTEGGRDEDGVPAAPVVVGRLRKWSPNAGMWTAEADDTVPPVI